MPKQVAHYKCLVISPGDVEDAREAVSEAITGWNAHAGEGLGVKIEAVRWESHARPEMGAPPQDIINKQIVDGCDFGIAIFWSRLGSPTAKHPSGSVEEIERLFHQGANVLVYFCDAPVPQSALKDDQFQRLQQVKEDFRKRGLYSGYNTTDDLRRVLPLHISGTMSNLLKQQRLGSHPVPSTGAALASPIGIASPQGTAPIGGITSARELWVTGQPRYNDARRRLQAIQFAPEINFNLPAVAYKLETQARASELIEARRNLEQVTQQLEAEFDSADTTKAPRESGYHFAVHREQGTGRYILEFRPVAGAWSPFFAAVPASEKDSVKPHIMTSAAGRPQVGGALFGVSEGIEGEWAFKSAQNAATPTTSYFIYCTQLPSKVAFGVPGHGYPQYTIENPGKPNQVPKP